MRKFALLAAALIGLAVTTPARADIEVGTLTCRSSAASTYIVVSGRCIFAPSDGRPVQYYQAVVHRFGAQVGFSNDVALGWAVLAPTPHVGPGSLAGGYGGLVGGAAVVVGVAANGLVGGANLFTLPPFSVQGEAGVKVVFNVAGLDPKPIFPLPHFCH